MTLIWIGSAILTFLVFGVPGFAAENSDFDRLRQEMVRSIEAEARLTQPETGIADLEPRILKVMLEVPRHEFVPAPLRAYSYANSPLPLGYGQNIASPFLVALMTQLARPEKDDAVFETGTGSGYQAAILSKLVAEVYSVEVVEPLAEEAAVRLARLGYRNAHINIGDGYYGWPAKAPFDAIILKEAVDHVPDPLLGQLKAGGRMVLPLGPSNGVQYLTVIEKRADGSLNHTRVLPVRFSPLQGGSRL